MPLTHRPLGVYRRDDDSQETRVYREHGRRDRDTKEMEKHEEKLKETVAAMRKEESVDFKFSVRVAGYHTTAEDVFADFNQMMESPKEADHGLGPSWPPICAE